MGFQVEHQLDGYPPCGLEPFSLCSLFLFWVRLLVILGPTDGWLVEDKECETKEVPTSFLKYMVVLL